MKRKKRSMIVLVLILVVITIAAYLAITSGIFAVVLDPDDETLTSTRESILRA
ncbi:MAG: hypothetical protein V7618_10135 [Rhodoglobus sp.]|uniref:hypothetical protein n=1 Tax=uncultured Salinibacterium sp. TaxID=459274 RepID=UPI0030DA881C